MPSACVMLVLNAPCKSFFSSRRRHTICSRDWSSDVCSSDLIRAVHLNFQMAVSPVLCRVVADETQNVVRRSVLLDLRKDSAEVVRIKKGLAASVGGKRRERFLGGGVVVQIVQYGLPGIGGLPVQARRLRLAARGKCLQAAEVHRIDGHVRLDRRGGGGAQSRLIVRAGLADAVAEADEAFLLREFAEPLQDRKSTRLNSSHGYISDAVFC